MVDEAASSATQLQSPLPQGEGSGLCILGGDACCRGKPAHSLQRLVTRWSSAAGDPTPDSLPKRGATNSQGVSLVEGGAGRLLRRARAAGSSPPRGSDKGFLASRETGVGEVRPVLTFDSTPSSAQVGAWVHTRRRVNCASNTHPSKHRIFPSNHHIASMSTVDFASFSNVVAGGLRSGTTSGHGVDPSTRKPLWDIPIASADDLEDAVKAARAAFPSWSRMRWRKRQALLRQAAALLQKNREAMGKLISSEGGKPPQFADLEVQHAQRCLEYYGTTPCPSSDSINADTCL